MKFFPSNFTAQKNRKTGAAPFWILECPFATGTIYLADYTVQFSSWKGGALTKPWVKNWGRITEDISNELALTRVSSFSLDVIIDPNVSSNMETILENAANSPETTDCRLYLAFRDLTGPLESTDPPQLMWRGNITDWRKIDEMVIELEMNDISVRLDKYVGTKLSLDDYPDACPEDVGKVLPIVYGEKNVVTGLRSAWGARTTLAAAITAASTSCEVTDGEDLPTSGSMWIDDEKIGYSSLSKVEGTLQITYTLNGLTRGQSSTTAAPHSQGAQVWEYRSHYESILADHTLKTIRAVYAQVGGDLLKVISGISALVVNGRHVLRATQTFKTKPVTEITVSDNIAVSDPGHTHGVASTEKRYGTSASYSRAYSYFTFTPTTGGELNLYDGSDISSVKATYNGTSEDTATITVSFPTYNGPTPTAVYAIITHTSYKSTSGAPATATVKIGSTSLDVSNVKVTQRIPLGTTVPASITIQAVHPVYSTSYQVQTEVFEVSMEVVTQATTSNPAAVSKSGTVTATGGVIQTRMVDRFVALVDGYAPAGTVIKRPDEIMSHFLQTYAGWNPGEFFSDLALGTPIDSRLLGAIIGDMTEAGGLAAAFDDVVSQPAVASARISDSGEDTRTLGTTIGDMTEAGGLAAAFDNVTSQSSANCARKTTTTLDLRTLGTTIGNMTQGGGLAAAFDGTTNQTQAQGAYYDIPYRGQASVGKDWGAGNGRIITAFTVYAPNNTCFHNGTGGVTIALHGTNNNDWANGHLLYLAENVTQSVGQVFSVTSGIDTSTAYEQHQVVIYPYSYQAVRVAAAEVVFTSGAPITSGRVGKNWGAGVVKRVKGFTVYPSSDAGFLSTGGAVDITLKGSTDSFVSSSVDLFTASDLSNANPISVASGIDTSVAYQYHCLEIRPHGSSNVGDVVYLAELTLNCFANGNLKGHVGKDWGSGVTRTVRSLSLYSPSDSGFLSTGGNINVRFLASTDTNITNAVELYSANGLSGTSPITITSGVNASSAYRCHWIEITPAAYPSTDFSLMIAEAVINYTVPTGCENYAFSIVIDSYARLKNWLAKMAWECRCYFRFAAGKAELLLRQNTLTPIKTITAHMTAMDNSFRTMTRTSRSRLEDIINKIEVHYYRDPLKSGADSYRRSYKTSDAASIQKYGEKEKPELFNFDFVRDDAMAQSVAAFYLARYKDRKKLVELNVFLDNVEIEFSDGVLMGELGDILFEVQQANIEPGSGRDMRNDRVHLVVKEY